MVVDPVLRFGARRDVPIRYNREHVQATLKAIERINEIRERRERVFYKKRMAGNKERQKAADRKLVAENSHLLPKMRGSERRKLEEAGEEIDEDEIRLENRATVFGKQKMKLLVDGGVEGEDMDMDE